MNGSPLPLHGGLSLWDVAAIVGYLILTLAIAIWFGQRQHNEEDFFVGGRTVPWFAVGLSILATLFSTLTYLGSPGEVIKNGLGVFTGYLSLPFSALVVLFLWIPFFMRLKLTSAYEYLELRFGPLTRLYGATLFVLMRLGWMSMVVFAASMALDRIKGADFSWLPGEDLFWWIVAIGVIATLYTTVGGIQAMIWTDVLQCILLLTGVVWAIGYVMLVDGTGPLDWWRIAAQTPGRNNLPPLFSTDLTVRVTVTTSVVSIFFWTVCTHGSDQVVLQRYFSTPSIAAARRSYCTNLVVDMTMAVLLATCGLALLAYYMRHPEQAPHGQSPVAAADRLFPHFLGDRLPAGLAGLIISAFLCDAIQTLESGVNAITAVVTHDLAPHLRRYGWYKLSNVTLARTLSLLIGVLVTCNAFFVADRVRAYGETIIGMMPKFFNMFVGPLAALFFLGMFVPRCTSRSALPAALLGMLVSILWSWWSEIFGTTWRPTFLLGIAAPCVATMLIGYLLSWIVDSGGSNQAHSYTWRGVVYGSPPSGTVPCVASGEEQST